MDPVSVNGLGADSKTIFEVRVSDGVLIVVKSGKYMIMPSQSLFGYRFNFKVLRRQNKAKLGTDCFRRETGREFWHIGLKPFAFPKRWQMSSCSRT